MSQDNIFGLKEWLADQAWVVLAPFDPHPHSDQLRTIFKGIYNNNHNCNIKGCRPARPTAETLKYYYDYLLARSWERRL